MFPRKRLGLRGPAITLVLPFAWLLTFALPGRADLPLTVRVKNDLAEKRTRAPVTWSVPFAPEDAVLDPLSLTLLYRGEPLAFQATPMARWAGTPADGSRPIAWLLLDLQLDLSPGEEIPLEIVRRSRTEAPSPLRISRDDAMGVVIETGAANYTLSRTAFRLFDRVVLSDATTFPAGGGFSYQGALVTPPAEISVEHSGPYRISLRVKGTIAGGLGFTARLHFYRELSEVKVDLRLENLTPYAWADNQPDCNSYGKPGSVSFDDFSIVIPALGGRDFRYAAGERGTGTEVSGQFTTALSLFQESSGDANWNVLQSEAPRLQSGVKKRTSTIKIDGSSQEGPNQLGEWLDSGSVTVAVSELWQNFPKALRAREGTVEAGLFPGEFSRNHELRSGEFKTHTIWIRHHAAADSDAASRVHSALSPLRILPDHQAVSRTRAAGIFTPRMTTAFPDYEKGVDYQIYESPEYSTRPWESTAPTILEAISLNQHYGWVDYGDVPTDFEPFNNEGTLSSPYNLKYDMLRGMIQQAFRSNDRTWWMLSASGARHASDIDMLHSKHRGRNASRSWPDGGMYGHGYHDERGNVNPHRNFMNPSVSMSGPPPGMFLWAHLTGDTLILDSAIEATDSIWWKITHSSYPGDGGCAASLRRCDPDSPDSCTGYEEADGGRTGGNAIKAFLSAYLATGEREYLDTIAQLASYLECTEARDGICCNRYHMQATMMTALGHYLLVRQWLNLGDDTAARSLLRRRLEYMKQRLYSPTSGAFSMCYLCDNDPDIEDCDESIMCPIWDNWLLLIADSFSLGSLLFSDRTYLTQIAKPLFEAGSRHPMGGDSTLAYHATKELTNQVGFGGIFLYAWQEAQATCSITCSAAAVPDGRTVRFSSTVQTTGCAGAPVFAWSFGDDQQSTEQNPVHVFATDGTFVWSLTVTASGQSCARNGSITVSSGGSRPHSYIVPAAARSTGALDSVWRTDLVVVNLGPQEAHLTVTLVPAEGPRRDREATIPARGTAEWRDVIGTLFGPDVPEKVSGVILIGSDSILAISSRTYNQRETGTFGGYLPAVRPSDGIAMGDTGYIPHLKQSDQYRTNIGITNLGKDVLTVSIQLFGATGGAEGTEQVLDVPGDSFRQIDDIFTKSGAGSQSIGFATVRVRSPGGRAWGYASVIDNLTGDPTLIPLHQESQTSGTSPRARSPLQDWREERRGGSLAEPWSYSLLTSCTPRWPSPSQR